MIDLLVHHAELSPKRGQLPTQRPRSGEGANRQHRVNKDLPREVKFGRCKWVDFQAVLTEILGALVHHPRSKARTHGSTLPFGCSGVEDEAAAKGKT